MFISQPFLFPSHFLQYPRAHSLLRITNENDMNKTEKNIFFLREEVQNSEKWKNEGTNKRGKT